MSDAQTSMTPTTDDFASMFEASVESNSMKEGSVISGRVTAIEKDIVVIDVGLKTEGRVPLREFYVPGQSDEDKVKVGDDVDIYLERIENALGDAILSRDKALHDPQNGPYTRQHRCLAPRYPRRKPCRTAC